MEFHIPFTRKKKPTVTRQFNAAQHTRLTADWISSPTSADAELQGNIATIRERARDLERNETYVEKFLFELENNIVGTGIKLRSEPRNPDGKTDALAKQAIEWAWYQQGQRENYTVTGQQTEQSADRLAIRSIARDGEVLVRIIRGAPNKFRFAVQLLEPDHLDATFSGKAPNGNEIRMGVELNEWKMPMAYWIDINHPGDYYQTMQTGGQRRTRIPADEMLMPFRSNRVEQTRGVSWLVTAMNHLKMLGGYEEAELVAARTAAAKMGFFVSDGTDYGQTDPSNPNADFSMEAEPGMFDQIPQGLKFQSWDPQHPTTAFEGFRKAMLRRVASGLTMSYNTLANDLEGVNYSSLRDGKITERDGYKVIQDWMIATYKRPIYLAWISWAIDTGQIKMNRGIGSPLPAAKMEKFTEHSFIPRRWQWVDPLKDMKAMELARKNNWTSDSQIVSEQGYDLTELYDQQAEDEELRIQKGIEKPIDKSLTSIQKLDTPPASQ